MICFNVPPFTGKELEYMKEAIEAQKICGDGQFTKKCNQWLEEKTGTKNRQRRSFKTFRKARCKTKLDRLSKECRMAYWF